MCSRALSLAIDREYVAKDIVVYAHPATGFIPYKVMDTKVGTSFREAGGDLLDTKANMEEAKALLKEAGVSGGELKVAYYKEDDVSDAIASYVKLSGKNSALQLSSDTDRNGEHIRLLYLQR